VVLSGHGTAAAVVAITAVAAGSVGDYPNTIVEVGMTILWVGYRP
jgi:hypothetical protein